MKPRRPGRSTTAATPPARQKGMSIWLVLVMGALLFIVGGAALRVLPTFLEYRSVLSALDQAVKAGTEPREIQKAFERAATIENITSITGADLIIDKTSEGVVASFAYERRVPLAGPVNILMDYRGSAKAPR